MNKETNQPSIRNLFSNTIAVYLTISIIIASVDTSQEAKRLYDALLNPSRYNKLIRPVDKYSDLVTIKLGLRLSQLIDVDEKREIIALNVWLLQEWTDVRLTWEPSEYSNLTVFNVPANVLWLPDIVLYNNADGDYTVTLLTQAKLRYTGQVTWEPPAIYRSQCDMDVEYFPFDEQVCHFKFGAWTYGSTVVDLQHKSVDINSNLTNECDVIDNAIDLERYFGNEEWDLINVEGRKSVINYPCCTDPYTDITFNIKIRRKRLFYTVNFIIPCIGINTLTYLTFYLPSDCGEKIALSIFTLLSLSLFQLLLIEIMPPTSFKIPLLGKYILFTTFVVCLSVLCSVVVLNIHYRSRKAQPMPAFARRLFLHILPRVLCMGSVHRKRDNRRTGSGKDFSSANCDLANYVNPYKNKFRPVRQPLLRDTGNDNVRLRTTFVGMNNMDINLSNICSACSERHMELPINAKLAIDGAVFIARHMQDDRRTMKIKDEWKFLAQVVDRLLLWLYTGGCIVGTFGILLNAPGLYDSETPLSGAERAKYMADVI